MGVEVTYGDYTFPNPTPSVTWSYGMIKPVPEEI